MAAPSDNDFPDAVSAPPGRTTRSTRKRKSDLISDVELSDSDVPVKPAKKKPGPKAKEKESSDVESIEEERPKPVKKKPELKPKPKAKPKQKSKRLFFSALRVPSWCASIFMAQVREIFGSEMSKHAVILLRIQM
ncbi:hypothetical protein B0H11DRAFT_1915857 [Mycena galericulata]|nr:hypothetical protein B0H11DRAFT_1915857 [Mycena galericulata]